MLLVWFSKVRINAETIVEPINFENLLKFFLSWFFSETFSWFFSDK